MRKHTLKKKKKSFGLFLNPLLWQDFHLKTRAVQNIERCNTEPNIKKRKQKNCRNLFFFSLHCLAAPRFSQKLGKKGMASPRWESRTAMWKVTLPSCGCFHSWNGSVELMRLGGVWDGAGERGRGHSWQTVAMLIWRKPNACRMTPPPPFSPCFPQLENCMACLSGELRGTISQWISGRPSSSGTRCTTCRGSPSRTPYGTSSPRHAPSDWRRDEDQQHMKLLYINDITNNSTTLITLGVIIPGLLFVLPRCPLQLTD